MKKLLILICIILTISFIQAQDNHFNLVVAPPSVEYNYISYNDLNWNSPEEQITLFALNVVQNQPPYDGELPEIRFSIEWNNIKVYDVYKPQDINGLTALNSSDFFNADYNNLDPLLDELKSIVIDTGKFPDGNYILKFVVAEPEPNDSNDSDEYLEDHALSNIATFTLTIKSPSPITLVSPGNPLGSSPVTINNKNPYFVWVSNVNGYTFKIWEENNSAVTEDQLETITPYYKADINTSNFEYPANAPALKYGKSYAWQIISNDVRSLSGETIELKSRMYHFKLSNTETANNSFNILEKYIKDFRPLGGEEFLKLIHEGYEIEQTAIDKIIDEISKGKKIVELTIE